MRFDFTLIFPQFFFFWVRHVSSSRYHHRLIANAVGEPHERAWESNLQAHEDEAYRKWPSLPEHQKRIFIERAKMEFRNHNGRK
jgi:hypothetical protein